MCAATPGVVDACVGDSGGPLDCWDRKRERQTIAGVVSFGKNCASETYAGVYTNVPFYATWIRWVSYAQLGHEHYTSVKQYWIRQRWIMICPTTHTI